LAGVEDFSRLFGNNKSIIGMVHLLPLPGSPRYGGNISEVVDRACQDGEALQLGGVDAVIIENYGDLPFFADRVPGETIAAMTAVASKVQHVIDLPIGINVLRNDGIAAVSIAAAIDADFIRINVYTGTVLTEQGIIQGCAAELMRHRCNLGARTLVLADIAVKHGRGLVEVPIKELAIEAVSRGLAEGVILTGSETGKPTDLEIVWQLKREFAETPILVGSGVNDQNIHQALKIADGVIVGTSLKIDGCTTSPVDVERVRNIVQVARRR
jgi:membrane complex biogenesis BtpA family protein